MYVVTVMIQVKPEAVGSFVEAMVANARGSRQEPGCLRFDVLRSEDDPTHFFLYEVYRSPEAFGAHQQTAHYLRWRDAVKDWMAQPRQGSRYLNVDPSDAEWT